VVVSHDRAFLERVATEVIQLDPHSHRTIRYRGGYAAYAEELERDRAHARAAYETYAGAREELLQRARRQREWARSGERSAHSAARDGRPRSAEPFEPFRPRARYDGDGIPSREKRQSA
jgi:ATPase subunit of ABC transporter with duplicated ATPase domains